MRKTIKAGGSAQPRLSFPAFPPLKTRKMSRVLDYSAAPSYLDSIGCKLYWSQGLTAVSSYTEAVGPFRHDCRDAAGCSRYRWTQDESNEDNEHEGWAVFTRQEQAKIRSYFMGAFRFPTTQVIKAAVQGRRDYGER